MTPGGFLQSIDGAALLRGVLAGGTAAGMALHDELFDAGATLPVAQEAMVAPPPRLWWDAGSGIGRGSGIGSGIGSGSGRGRGSGIGRGSGSGSGNPRVYQMETGKAYLIHCGDWHTFVGRVVGQVGPHTYQLESCSKVSDTGAGDVWDELAAGQKQARRSATYRHYKGLVTVVLCICAFEWEGKLPQEEKS